MKKLSITLIFVSFVYFLSAQKIPEYSINSPQYKTGYQHDFMDNLSIQDALTANADENKSYKSLHLLTEGSICPDSVIVTSENQTYREIYMYDEFGYLSQMNWKFLENGQWMNGGWNFYAHDEQGNIITHIEQIWDNDMWTYNTKIVYSYDTSGNLLIWMKQNWSDETWTNNRQVIFTYNSQHKMLTRLDIKWTNEAWENVRLDSLTYNSSGNNLTLHSRAWTSGEWVSSSLVTNTFENGERATLLLQYFEDDEWINLLFYNFEYDDDGNIISELTHEWINNEWVNDSWLANSYDNQGNRLTRLVQFWVDDSWKNTWHSEYIYDMNNNMIEEKHKDWDNNVWLNNYKVDYTFFQDSIYAQCYEWEENDWIESSENEVLSVVMNGERIFRYSAINIQIYHVDISGYEEEHKENLNSSISCFPNPALESIQIELHNLRSEKALNIELYTLSGIKVKSIDGSSHKMNEKIILKLDDIPSGMYLIKIKSEDQSFTQKVIVSR